jgi:hypothetical protein
VTETLVMPPWGPRYPDPALLRREAVCLANAFAGALLEVIPEQDIEGIYLKGSTQKEWDSPIDYVAEISDVDIHLLFADGTLEQRHLGTVTQALDIQARAERRFLQMVPHPCHFPRPQLLVLNRLLQDQDYVRPPKKSVAVLYGRDLDEPDYGDGVAIRETDCRRLRAAETVLPGLPHQAVDRPSRYLWELLRLLSWRVAPTGPRALDLLGVRPERAWSINRTAIVGLLQEVGEAKLAGDYAGYYLSAWDYVLSGREDGDAGRASAASGVRVLERGIEIATGFSERAGRSP